MAHLCSALPKNGTCRTEVALGESVSEQYVNVKAQDITEHYCGLYKDFNVYIKLIKQQEIKSSTRENAAIKRFSKHKMYEAAANVTQHALLQQTFVI